MLAQAEEVEEEKLAQAEDGRIETEWIGSVLL